MKWINHLYTRSCGVPQESPFIFTWQVTTSMFLLESLQDTTQFSISVWSQNPSDLWSSKLYFGFICVWPCYLSDSSNVQRLNRNHQRVQTVTRILHKVQFLLFLTILSPGFGAARCGWPPLLEVHYWWLGLTLCCCCLERDTEALRKLN